MTSCPLLIPVAMWSGEGNLVPGKEGKVATEQLIWGSGLTVLVSVLAGYSTIPTEVV